MRLNSSDLTSTSHIAANAASINEFFEDHFSRSEVILDELEAAWTIKKDQASDDKDLDDPEDWIHTLYTKQVLARP